jgi:hypothetical protein
MRTPKIMLVCLCALIILITILPLSFSTNSSELGNTKRLASLSRNKVLENETPIGESQVSNSFTVDERVFADPSTIPNYRVSGLLHRDISEYDEYQRSNSDMPILLDGPIPQSVANLVGLPPIGDQGSQGSCAAWAWGYYCLTHQIAAANGYWDTSTSSHQFSPAYIYNQINDGGDSGSWPWDASCLTEAFGCATLDMMAYSDTDCITWPSEAAYTEAMRYRTVNPTWDRLSDDADLDVLKAYLADGNTAVTSILIYPAFYDFNTVNNVYTTSHIVGDPIGGHAVCLVGYDDNKATTDGPGAFLLVNSWGPGWGDNGFWWMSYEAIKNYDISYQEVYYCDVISQPHSPDLVGSIRLSHEKRGDVLEAGLMISLEVNGYEQHWELLSIGSNQADRSGLYQNHPFPGNPLVFDLSDFTPYLSMYFENEFILLIGDSVWPVSGVLESFTVTSLEYSIEASSSQTPHAILDNQPREEVSAFLVLPCVTIDTLDTYVGGTVGITGTVHGESEDTVVDIGFEPGSFEHPWYTNDDNPDNGDQLWGVDTYHSFSGGSSIWCGGTPSSTAIYTEHFNPILWLGWPSGWTLYSSGANSHPWTSAGVPLEYEITCSTGGLSNVKEWAAYGPRDTSSATELCLTFWMDYEVQSAAANNFASVLYSTDGNMYTYLKRWYAPVGETCSFIGEQKVMLPEDAISSTLYFAFIFQGDYAGSMTVDDIDIWDIGSQYENYADSYAYCYIDISNFDSATMSFDYWADVEDGWDWFSPAYYIGSTWTTPYSLGTTTGWQHFTLSIPTSATRIGFLFHSDVSIVEHGVYVDNVKVIGSMDPISAIEISVDETSQGLTPCLSTWSFMWDTTTVTDGLHNVSASAVFRGSTISDTENTFVDNTAPFLSSDTRLYQSGNNITICGYANSLGGSSITSLVFTSGDISEYFLASPIQGTIINSTTVYWWLSNSTSIPDGHYLFQMTLADYTGNEYTKTLELTVDNSLPTISQPSDIVYAFGTSGNIIRWDCTDLHPDYYELYQNGVLIATNSWTDGLSYSVDGLDTGSYTFTVIFYDLAGNSVTDSVLVTVSSGTSTTETTTTPTTGTTGTTSDTSVTTTTASTDAPDSSLLSSVIVIAIAAGSIIIIVVVLIQIKRNR